MCLLLVWLGGCSWRRMWFLRPRRSIPRSWLLVESCQQPRTGRGFRLRSETRPECDVESGAEVQLGCTKPERQALLRSPSGESPGPGRLTKSSWSGRTWTPTLQRGLVDWPPACADRRSPPAAAANGCSSPEPELRQYMGADHRRARRTRRRRAPADYVHHPQRSVRRRSCSGRRRRRGGGCRRRGG
jgi:hypothetical protein